MKRSVICLVFALVLFSTFAWADADMMDFSGSNGMMSNYGMGGFLGMGILGLIYLAIAAFIFSLIFWLTYKWLIKKD